MSNNDSTFVTNKITNRDIYERIGNVETYARETKEATAEKLKIIEQKIDYTNGKVRFNRALIAGEWIAIASIAAVLLFIANKLL